MGHLPKVLIGALAHARLLLPERVLADTARANAFSDEQIDDAA
jgi:hypothetical protein